MNNNKKNITKGEGSSDKEKLLELVIKSKGDKE